MFFKGKHEAARMELRFINKTGNRHFDKPSYIYIYIQFGPVGTVSGLIYCLVSIHCPMGWMIFLSRGVSLLECEQSRPLKKAY